MSTTIPNSPGILDSTGISIVQKLQGIIDALGGGGGTMAMPPEYDPDLEDGSGYYYGQYVTYNDSLYRCITDISTSSGHPAGAWDSSKWTEITDLFNEFFQYKPGQIVNIATKGEIFNNNSNTVPNVASGYQSHAEGNRATASGRQSHAEGNGCTASGSQSHAECNDSSAYGFASHSEGSACITGGSGLNEYSFGTYSHAEGYNTRALGSSCHTEGNNTQAGKTDTTVYYAHAEGSYSKALANSSHAEGYNTQATADSTHAEGYGSIASNSAAHAEGNSCTASGSYSHAEGSNSSARGTASHSEGIYNIVDADSSCGHAEGNSNNIYSASYSHVEGYSNQVYGYISHCEGQNCKTYGSYSHAGGYDSNTGTSDGKMGADCTFAHGRSLRVTNYQEVAFGRFNKNLNSKDQYEVYNPNIAYNVGRKVKHDNDGIIYECNTASTTGTWDSSKWDDTGETYEPVGTVFTIGNGTSSTNMSNLFELRSDGTGYLNNEQLLALNPPTTDGTYTLQVTVTNGVPVFSWV